MTLPAKIEREHAVLSPSGAERWTLCPASVAEEGGLPDVSSEYAEKGTRLHKIAAEILVSGRSPQWETLGEEDRNALSEYTGLLSLLARGRPVLVEQRLPIDHITLEDNAKGTADAIVLYEDEKAIGISDLKTGKGHKVFAEGNLQLVIYALAALREYESVCDWEKVALRIHQPFLEHFDEWCVTRKELEKIGKKLTQQARAIWKAKEAKTTLAYNPKEAACRFCKAKATCKAHTSLVFSTIAGDFEDLSDGLKGKVETAIENLQSAGGVTLAYYFRNLETVQAWVKAVEKRVYAELMSGSTLPGLKLVAGKKGNRKWQDEDAVEKELKALCLKTEPFHKTELVSPPAAEKLLKDNKAIWDKLKAHVVQPDGKPSVALENDPRPALDISVAGDFELLTQETET